jgi:glycosyltransferase involved in cell wall biosynthesis
MPLLSIVIPTHKRPRLVVRAISSALDVYKNVDLEILVVPNGQDDTWRAIAEQHGHDPRIQWHYLPAGNACAARNHGLAKAQGKYLRFLDDDDYLLPAAAEQLELIERERLDACSAPLEFTTADGIRRYSIGLPVTDDFVSAAIHSVGIGLTQGSIFRTSRIREIRWRENVDLYDDYLWMLDVVTATEMTWTKTPAPVCTYVQHDGVRLSRIRRSNRNSRILVDALLHAHRELQAQGRLSPRRNEAVAAALLTHAHSAFPASPVYLSAAIRKAKAIASDAAPLQPIFERHPWLNKHLLLIEWAALAPRYVTRGYRRASWFVGRLLNRLNS